MRKIFKIDTDLQNMFDAYFESVEKYAEEVFEAEILPWLKKYHLVFISGNGTFYIGYTDKTPRWFVSEYSGYGEDSLDTDKLPDKILGILATEIGGYDYNLGSIMPDYRDEQD